MINVDHETKNVRGGSGVNCASALHRQFENHFDLTIHELGASCKRKNSVSRDTRYWDDNDGDGYSFCDLPTKIDQIQDGTRDAHPRRCGRCDVPVNLVKPPHWD